ncbi:MAG: E2/UBC family protein, partial [Bacteroidales bacterium]|nr:E2/UBC family protein [Bacteroidales bacterium]
MSLADIFQQINKDAVRKLHIELSGDPDFEELIESQNHYPNCVAVWRTFINAQDKNWEVHIVILKDFPFSVPKVFIMGGEKLFLKLPHIDKDGSLCIIPNEVAINSKNPVGLFFHLVNSTKRILQGTDEADFQIEFISYWGRDESKREPLCLLLNSPEKLNISIHIYIRKKIVIIANDRMTITEWIENQSGMDIELEMEQNGLCIDLNEPLLPESYPNSLYDLLALVNSISSDGYKLLIQRIIESDEKGIIIFRNITKNGYILLGVVYKGL